MSNLLKEIRRIGRDMDEACLELKVLFAVLISGFFIFCLAMYRQENYRDVSATEYRRIQKIINTDSDAKAMFFELYKDRVLSSADCRIIEKTYEDNIKSAIVDGVLK